MNWALLTLSVVLTAGRNLLSKSISARAFGTAGFFRLQGWIFGVGAAVLFFPAAIGAEGVSPVTAGYALLYGLFLVGAQWCSTVALGRGNTTVCATVYSLGFILPTLSGMVFWKEPVTLWKIVGIVTVFPALILSGRNSRRGSATGHRYIIPLITAMLCSGGLGILQKIQQSSAYPRQRTAFVCIAFAFAALFSLLCGVRRRSSVRTARSFRLAASGVGVCFALCNLLNTFLAGRMESAVFFPCLNVGAILLSCLLSLLLLREKLSGRHVAVLAFGTLSVLLIGLSSGS